MKPGIIFVSSAIQQPRHQRRIFSLTKRFDLCVFFVQRDQYANNKRPLNCKAKMIGRITKKKGHLYYILSRSIINFKLFILLVFIRRKNLVYVTSPDQALVAILAFRRFIIEYGDVQALSYKSRVSKFIDKVICKFAHGLVITSPAYFSDYFKYLGCSDKDICVAENKIPLDVASGLCRSKDRLEFQATDSVLSTRMQNNNVIVKLGLIGALNRFDIYEIYLRVLKENTDFALEVYGDDGNSKFFDGIDRVVFHGPFRNPEDLNKIYNSVDIVLLNYDASDLNVKIALPNKLYESIFFRKPIICTQGTFLAEVVKRKGIGFSSELSEESIEKSIRRCLNHDFNDAWNEIPDSEFISDNSHVVDFVENRISSQYS